MGKRIKPLPQALPVYEHDWSDYPDRLRVAMDDGKVVDYVLQVTQPKPVLKDLLDKLDETVFGGYKYKDGKRTKLTGSKDGGG